MNLLIKLANKNGDQEKDLLQSEIEPDNPANRSALPHFPLQSVSDVEKFNANLVNRELGTEAQFVCIHKC